MYLLDLLVKFMRENLEVVLQILILLSKNLKLKFLLLFLLLYKFSVLLCTE